MKPCLWFLYCFISYTYTRIHHVFYIYSVGIYLYTLYKINIYLLFNLKKEKKNNPYFFIVDTKEAFRYRLIQVEKKSWYSWIRDGKRNYGFWLINFSLKARLHWGNIKHGAVDNASSQNATCSMLQSHINLMRNLWNSLLPHVDRQLRYFWNMQHFTSV